MNTTSSTSMPLAPREPRATRLRAWPLACAASLALHGVVWAWCGSWTWDAGGARAPVEPDEFVFELRLRAGGAPRDEQPPSANEPAPAPEPDAVTQAPEHTLDEITPESLPTLAAAFAPQQVNPVATDAPATEVAVAPEPTFAPTMSIPPVVADAGPTRPVARDPEQRRERRPSAVHGTGAIASAVEASAPGASVSSAASSSSGSGEAGHGTGAASGDGASDVSSQGTRELVAISTPRPIYPHESELRGEYGVVSCLLHVDTRGIVTQVDVLATSGHRRLDQAAVDGLKLWRFEPALENGHPIEAKLRHQVRFVFR